MSDNDIDDFDDDTFDDDDDDAKKVEALEDPVLAHLTSLEKRRLIDNLMEEKRLARELKDGFDDDFDDDDLDDDDLDDELDDDFDDKDLDDAGFNNSSSKDA